MVGLFGVLSSGVDDEGFAGCFDDVGGDVVELVDVHDGKDLGRESFDEAEVPAGDSDDGEGGFGVGFAGGVKGAVEVLPVCSRGRGDVFGVQWSVWWTNPMRL